MKIPEPVAAVQYSRGSQLAAIKFRAAATRVQSRHFFKKAEGMGLESVPVSAEKRAFSKTYAPAYATGPISQVTDQSLAEVVASWRFLSEAAKADVSALVRAALAEEGRG